MSWSARGLCKVRRRARKERTPHDTWFRPVSWRRGKGQQKRRERRVGKKMEGREGKVIWVGGAKSSRRVQSQMASAPENITANVAFLSTDASDLTHPNPRRVSPHHVRKPSLIVPRASANLPSGRTGPKSDLLVPPLMPPESADSTRRTPRELTTTRSLSSHALHFVWLLDQAHLSRG